MILGQNLVTNLVVAQEYKFLKKKLTLLHFENLTIGLHVFYTLNTHIKFYAISMLFTL